MFHRRPRRGWKDGFLVRNRIGHGRMVRGRLVADSAASLAARLSSASGMEIDSLVFRWRNGVLAARPARLTLPWWASVAAVGWTALFGFCALRSSRWRQ